MYGTIRRYEGVTDPERTGRLVQEGFVPLLRGLPGFVAYYWIDAGDGVVISTSVFESRESADASNKKALEWLRQNVSPLPRATQITAGEVVVSTVRQPAAASR